MTDGFEQSRNVNPNPQPLFAAHRLSTLSVCSHALLNFRKLGLPEFAQNRVFLSEAVLPQVELSAAVPFMMSMVVRAWHMRVVALITTAHYRHRDLGKELCFVNSKFICTFCVFS